MEVIVTIVSKLVYKLFMGRIQPTYRDYNPFTTDRYISYQQDIPVPAGQPIESTSPFTTNQASEVDKVMFDSTFCVFFLVVKSK